MPIVGLQELVPFIPHSSWSRLRMSRSSSTTSSNAGISINPCHPGTGTFVLGMNANHVPLHPYWSEETLSDQF